MRGKENLPVSLHNLGCQAGLEAPFWEEGLYTRMDRRMAQKAVEVPIFLVSPEQMDLLLPPEVWKCLDPARVREHFFPERRRDEEPIPIEEMERLFREGRWLEEEQEEGSISPIEELESLAGECPSPFAVGAGLYLGTPPEGSTLRAVAREAGDPQGAAALQGLDGPSIYLCCARIGEWADRAGVPYRLALAKVLYHELGHALMDTGTRPPGMAMKVVEESLANWVAVNRFRGREQVQVQRLIRHQPAEHQAYAAVEEVVPQPMQWPIRDWALWKETWDEFFLNLRDPFLTGGEAWVSFLSRMQMRGLLFPLFSSWATVPGQALGSLAYRLWRQAKRQGLASHPGVLGAWAQYARELLFYASI